MREFFKVKIVRKFLKHVELFNKHVMTFLYFKNYFNKVIHEFPLNLSGKML